MEPLERKTSAQPASAISVQLQGNISSCRSKDNLFLRQGEMNVNTCLSPLFHRLNISLDLKDMVSLILIHQRVERMKTTIIEN